MTGTALVLATWLVLATVVVSSGLLGAHFVGGHLPMRLWFSAAIWWGLGLLTTAVLVLSLLLPLRSPTAAAIAIGVVLLLSAPGWWLVRAKLRESRHRWGISRYSVLLSAALLGAIVYLAFKTLGPATNYDTGLYHYGTIRYAGDYGTVPGLANLFVPFGYANAQFPLAAALTNSPWGIEGWRLLNGLIFVLVSLELMFRVTSRRWTWGTFLLAIGVGAVSLPVVGMADALMTSPTSDTSVLLLTLVAAAYLCDVVEDPRHPAARVSVVIVTTALCIAMRPTMLVFAAGLVFSMALLLFLEHRMKDLRPQFWMTSGIWLALLGGVQALRDYYLSAWFLYPLSLFHWDVPWLARDPVSLREATLAAARNPLDPDGYQVAHTWNWIGPWIQRLPSQWETWFLLVGLVVAGISLILVRSGNSHRVSGRLLGIALLPSLLAVAAWFLASPPSFRFAWGPIFLIPIIVIAWSMVNASQHLPIQVTTLTLVSLTIAGVTAYSSAFRSQAPERTGTGYFIIGSVNVHYSLAPLPNVPTHEVIMKSGLVVQEPDTGDQCWANYPLCTFSMGDNITYLDDSIGSGFAREKPSH